MFFTDGFNQPRKINVEKAINQKATDTVPYYTTEEKISVAKFAPFTAPLLLDYETTTYNQNIVPPTLTAGGTTTATAFYERNLYQIDFYDAAIGGNLIGSYFFYRSPLTLMFGFESILFDENGGFIYLNPNLSEVLVGYSEVFVNTVDNQGGSSQGVTFFKIQLNSVTGEVLNTITTGPVLGETTDIPQTQPQLIANQGDSYTATLTVDPSFVNLGPTSSMQTNTSFPDDVMDEKFVRFSYRYRFVDGEYSTIAPFTQVCFIPKTPNLDASHIQKLLSIFSRRKW